MTTTYTARLAEEAAQRIERGEHRSGYAPRYEPTPRHIIAQRLGLDLAPAPAPVPVPQPAPTTVAAAPTSMPVWTVEVEGLIFTVIQVNVGLQEFQLYTVDKNSPTTPWSLVGLFGLYVDALTEIQTWRAFLQQGGSLQLWMKQNPHGITPKLRRQ